MVSKTAAKRLIALVFAFLMVAGVVPNIRTYAKELTIFATNVDATRGNGEVIVYTETFGTSTKTNEWGYEVVVGADNVVTKVGGKDNKIPSGGFVVSGHNGDTDDKKMGKWLEENVEVGDYVYFNESIKSILITDTPRKQSSFYTLTTDFTKLNGVRNENNLVIYTNKGKKTATNIWGFEVVVENGVIVSIGGNDSLIPNKENSFVVSGHGTKATWLKSYAQLGMKVTYDAATKQISFVYDEEAAATGIKIQIETIVADLAKAKETYRYIDIAATEEAVTKLKTDFLAAEETFKNGGTSEDFDDACISAKAQMKEINKMLIESRTVEYRGVWIRPTQKTQKAVDDYVNELYEAGINLICIETLYDCTMIMPMPEDSLFEQNPAWKGFDMLQAYIDACHKRGMELHLWLPTFYVGHPDSKNTSRSLGAKKPEWLSVNNKGTNYTPDDMLFMMINPANKEARDFLLKTYEYIFTNYDIDGFQLDYIRYFVRMPEYDYGYDEYTLSAFEEKYGVRPEYNMNASYWNDWVAFRAGFVTEMVKEVRELIDRVRPSVLLTAAVGPDIEDAYNNIYQDYGTWLERGYLDMLHPMSYAEGYDDAISRQVEICKEDIYLVVGRSTQEFGAEDATRQAITGNKLGADGTAFFESSSFLAKGTESVLLESLYKKKAINPTIKKKEGIAAYIDYAVGRIEDIMLPLKGVTNDEANALKTAFSALKSAVEQGSGVKEKLNAVKDKANALANENATKAVLADIAYLNKMINVSERVPDRVDIVKNDPETSTPESAVESEASSEEGISSSTFDWRIAVAIVAVIAVAAVVVVVLKRKK